MKIPERKILKIAQFFLMHFLAYLDAILDFSRFWTFLFFWLTFHCSPRASLFLFCFFFGWEITSDSEFLYFSFMIYKKNNHSNPFFQMKSWGEVLLTGPSSIFEVRFLSGRTRACTSALRKSKTRLGWALGIQINAPRPRGLVIFLEIKFWGHLIAAASIRNHDLLDKGPTLYRCAIGTIQLHH